MRRRIYLLVLGTSLAITCHAQAASPIQTYKLHAQAPHKDANGSPLHWALAPDNSILVLLWQKDGGLTLKRISSWQTNTPREETLTLDGAPARSDINVFPELILIPKGKYLVIRLWMVHNKLDPSGKRKREAVIAVIDLPTFGVVSRTVTTDSRFADGSSSVNNRGVLMSMNYGSFTPHAGRTYPPGTFGVEATALSVPDLAPIATCQYNMAYGARDTQTGKITRMVMDANESCPVLLQVASVSSVSDLPGFDPVDQRFNEIAGPNCHRTAFNKNESLALYECGIEHLGGVADGMFGFETSQALKVLSIPDGKVILALPRRFLDSGVFATVDGQNFILVLNGLELEIYRLS